LEGFQWPEVREKIATNRQISVLGFSSL